MEEETHLCSVSCDEVTQPRLGEDLNVLFI